MLYVLFCNSITSIFIFFSNKWSTNKPRYETRISINGYPLHSFVDVENWFVLAKSDTLSTIKLNPWKPTDMYGIVFQVVWWHVKQSHFLLFYILFLFYNICIHKTIFDNAFCCRQTKMFDLTIDTSVWFGKIDWIMKGLNEWILKCFNGL